MSKNFLTIFLFIQICLTSCDSYNSVYLNKIEKTINAGQLFNAGDFRGKGSFGQVNFVEYDGVYLAIKKIKLARTNSDAFKRKYDMAIHEINILNKLSTSQDGDKYFPYFYGCGFQGNSKNGPMNIFVIQEILYKDLKKENARNLVNYVVPKDRIKLYLELAKGLYHMHKNHYVHSDLKPENMMTNQSVRKGFSGLHFKIIDFGMTDTISNYVMGGSPVYNSPEKINGDSRNKFSHDIWAYGLTVAAIESGNSYLFGNMPNTCFKTRFTTTCGRTLLINVGRVVDDVFGKNSAFSRVIKNCLVYDKSRRTQSMKDVVKAIEKILQDNEEEINIKELTTTVNKKDSFVLQGTELENQKEIERIAQLTNRVKNIRDNDGKIQREVVRHAYNGYKKQPRVNPIEPVLQRIPVNQKKPVIQRQPKERLQRVVKREKLINHFKDYIKQEKKITDFKPYNEPPQPKNDYGVKKFVNDYKRNNEPQTKGNYEDGFRAKDFVEGKDLIDHRNYKIGDNINKENINNFLKKAERIQDILNNKHDERKKVYEPNRKLYRII